jgi:hypothetical protein
VIVDWADSGGHIEVFGSLGYSSLARIWSEASINMAKSMQTPRDCRVNRDRLGWWIQTATDLL